MGESKRLNCFTECLISISGIADKSSLKDCVEFWYFSLSLVTFNLKSSISPLKLNVVYCIIMIIITESFY